MGSGSEYYFSVKLTIIFSKTTLLQRELFLTMVYALRCSLPEVRFYAMMYFE